MERVEVGLEATLREVADIVAGAADDAREKLEAIKSGTMDWAHDVKLTVSQIDEVGQIVAAVDDALTLLKSR